VDPTPNPHEAASPRPSAARFVLLAVAGFFVTAVVAFDGSSIGAPAAMPIVLLGLTVTGWSLLGAVRRAGTVGRLGLGVLTGVFGVLIGFALASWSYDERYFGDDSLARLTDEPSGTSAIWELVSLVGFGMLIVGAIVIVASLVSFFVVGTRRLLRST
jgi:hypothetical protein